MLQGQGSLSGPTWGSSWGGLGGFGGPKKLGGPGQPLRSHVGQLWGVLGAQGSLGGGGVSSWDWGSLVVGQMQMPPPYYSKKKKKKVLIII